MNKHLSSSKQNLSRTRPGVRPGHVRAHLAALQAQINTLEAQLASQRALQSTMSTVRLNALLTISAALLITREIDAILQLVVREAPALFPGASGIMLYLADGEQRLMLQAASSGPTPELILRPGQGIAGRAFLAPRAMLLSGPELELALDELAPEQVACVQSLLDPWPPSCALLAPLRSAGQRLGALAIYGGTQAHLFLPRDLPFVQALADLAAVAIIESRARERAGALQRDLARIQVQQAETQARLSLAQAQLLQSAKLAAVGELAASIAHEINNPLYAARNGLYLVEQDLPADAPQRPFLALAQTELGRIARIIGRMRDFYRPSRTELEPTDLNTVIEETIELVQTHLRHGSISVIADLAPQLPTIVAHTDQLRQVILNLMLNACDAMPAGGTLRVTTEHQPAQPDQGAALIVRIEDTGIGIPPEHQPHLFEPFYTTKPHGTGLGLAISAHIVTQHGGQISVESTVGVGSTFTIVLPLS